MLNNLGNYSFLAIAIFTSGILMTSSTTGNTLEMKENQQLESLLADTQNFQTTTINLDLGDIQSPQILKIRVPKATEVSGKIKVNGQVIKNINNPDIKVDLSSYISKKGKYIIEISGVYNPDNITASVKYLAPGNHISQTTGGSGSINQVLAINVR